MDKVNKEILPVVYRQIRVRISDSDKTQHHRLRMRIYLLLPIVLLFLFVGKATSQPTKSRWWSDATELSLEKSGTNRQELVRALDRAPINQREGIQFLVEHMPLRDLQTLPADYLQENLTMAYKAFEEAPWSSGIPKDIFLNDVLPYASTTESRDNWRKRLYEICRPLVKNAKTSSEACRILNEQIFTLLNVKYSTKRRVADQGPLETIETGIATCTGLSILLVDACRSVGVPARIAGTPLWSNNSGNHTWIEVWDGDWLFTGAAEQSPEGFNRGWFVGNASTAIKDDRRRAIYAGSFKKTGLTFPMTWARDADYVNAVNVTDRYTAGAKPEVVTGLRLMLDVFDQPVGKRMAAKVTVTDAANQTVRFEGISKGDTADMNDHLFFHLPLQKTYIVEVEHKNQKIRQNYTSGTDSEDKLPVFLGGIPPVTAPSANRYTPSPVIKLIGTNTKARLKEALAAFFIASSSEQANWKFPGSLEKLLRINEPSVRHAAWEIYRKAPIHDSLRKDFESNKVSSGNHVSPYTVKTVGIRPPNGWALFIAMHGGGGVPQEFNDRQWKHMQIYYRDHPEAGGYIYVALRAPDNTWNGFYTGYTYPLIQNLLRQFMLFGDVDPGKKFIMGYSHGGYGAFAIGPKMPDHFAAIHASAAAPADGAVPLTLRNTVFTTMVGAKDTMYGRYRRILKFENDVKQLRGARTDIYPVTVQVVEDHPHSGLPDRDKVAEMYPNVRNPVPAELTWLLSDSVITDFFWLHVPSPETGKKLDVTCSNNQLKVKTDLASASILLDSRLIDFNRPVILDLNGAISKHKLKPGLRTLCETMQRRGDPDLAFTSGLIVQPKRARP